MPQRVVEAADPQRVETAIKALLPAGGILKKTATVKTAYSHRMVMGDVQMIGDKTEWVCANCNEPVHLGQVNITYMTVNRSGPALVCPKCKTTMVEEYLAVKTLAAAEGLFEKKRA